MEKLGRKKCTIVVKIAAHLTGSDSAWHTTINGMPSNGIEITANKLMS